MSLTVTSNFNSKMNQTNPSSLVSKFTFVNSDITSRVKKFRPVSRDASQVIGGNFTLTLENASRDFDSLQTDKTQFLKEGAFDVGFATDSGTNDTIQIFGGKLTKAKYNNTALVLSFEDTLARLKSIKVGNKETPVSYTNTNVNPADLVWWLATSYGGLSVIASTSNPDIRYDTWVGWKQIFTDNNVTVQANFAGDKLPEIFSEIAVLTDSVIYAEGDNKLYFNRWTGAGSDTITITDSVILSKPTMNIDGTEMTNRVVVNYGYNVSSDSFAGGFTNENSGSVNSYGVHEQVYDSTKVWYVDSISANNLGERIVFRKSEPNIQIGIKVPLVALNAQLGDEIVTTTEIFSLNGIPYNLQGYKIDWEKKMVTLKLDEGFNKSGGRLNGFILDDVYYGLLDQIYNPLV